MEYPQYSSDKLESPSTISPVASSYLHRNGCLAASSVCSIAIDLLNALKSLQSNALESLKSREDVFWIHSNIAVHKFILNARWKGDWVPAFETLRSKAEGGQIDLQVIKELVWLLYSDELVGWGKHAASISPIFCEEFLGLTGRKPSAVTPCHMALKVRYCSSFFYTN